MNSDYSLAVTGAMEKQGQEMLGMVFAGAIKGGVNLSYGNRVIETVRQRKSFGAPSILPMLPTYMEDSTTFSFEFPSTLWTGQS